MEEEKALARLIQRKYPRHAPKAPRNRKDPLHPRYSTHTDVYELGMDEAGRGPMFGPLYVACVVLPHPSQSDFHFEWMKDSKRFHSDKKLHQVAEYIKENCVAYSIQSSSPEEIDRINIRQAVLTSMHQCVDAIHSTLTLTQENSLLLVDGCDFVDYTTPEGEYIPHMTIEGGDNWYCAIAAASILAKDARDTYIYELCDTYPELDTTYGIRRHKGYGTAQHRESILIHGITKWHRKTFGICKDFA